MSKNTGYIPFLKVESVGNHFVLIDSLDMAEMDWPSLATIMCTHRFGIGADGLLVLLPSKKADFRFRMFNPDGTEDICANGMRCATAYMHTTGQISKETAIIEAGDGLHDAEILGKESDVVNVRLNMKQPSFKPQDIPALVEADAMVNYPLDIGGSIYHVTVVSIGTPHAVMFTSSYPVEESFLEVSQKIERHPMFPKRINVTWCTVESSDSLKIQTWERGVGPTLGCGTGACAALAAAHITGLASNTAWVRSSGGQLYVEWPHEQDIFVSGATRIVYEGKWTLIQTEQT